MPLLHRQIADPEYRGCPLANATRQTWTADKALHEVIRRGIVQWQLRLKYYLNRANFRHQKINLAKSEELSRVIVMIYEGALAMFNMTKDMNYIILLEEEVMKLKYL